MRRFQGGLLKWLCAWLVAGGISAGPAMIAGGVFMGDGVKIGEVTSTGAMFWVRLTKLAEYKKDGIAFSPPTLLDGEGGRGVQAAIASAAWGYAHQIPPGESLAAVRTAMPGVPGEVRLGYREKGSLDARTTGDWVPVNPARDFTRQFVLSHLRPSTEYAFLVEARSPGATRSEARIEGSFRTAPEAGAIRRVVFTVVTGQRWDTRDSEKGQKIYLAMGRLAPSFFVHTGDIVYYDKVDPWVTHIDLARFKWNRTYAQPNLRVFHNRVPSYFMKDDHDSWQNDCWPGMKENRMGLFTWAQGRNVFLEQVPMGTRTYRTVRWGKDLQIWLVEGRDFRSPNDLPDGEEKTIWGTQQWAWFKRTVKASDATFRVLISPTPILGPDHKWKERKSDNLVARSRSYEGNRVRRFLAEQGMFIVCGDRHWQYVSRAPESGLTEYSCGPTTDKHATTLKNENHRMLRFLRGRGGFLSVTVERNKGVPRVAFRHHDVDGNVVHEEVVIR